MKTHDQLVKKLMKRPGVKAEVARIEREEGLLLDALLKARHDAGPFRIRRVTGFSSPRRCPAPVTGAGAGAGTGRGEANPRDCAKLSSVALNSDSSGSAVPPVPNAATR